MSGAPSDDEVRAMRASVTDEWNGSALARDMANVCDALLAERARNAHTDAIVEAARNIVGEHYDDHGRLFNSTGLNWHLVKIRDALAALDAARPEGNTNG